MMSFREVRSVRRVENEKRRPGGRLGMFKVLLTLRVGKFPHAEREVLCSSLLHGSVQETLKLSAANGMLQLADGFGFDLSDAFASHFEDAAHLF